MKRTIEILVLSVILCFIFVQNQRRSYWKERYESTAVWADTLYEENLRLCDTITFLKHQYHVNNSFNSSKTEMAR